MSEIKILVFLHGTILMHKNAVNHSREERVKQVKEGEKSIYDLGSYIPIGNAVQKLQGWRKTGAEIYYLSPHKQVDEVKIDETVLQQYGFPDGPVYYDQKGAQYKDVAESILPDILIEDDCESIGGEREMTYPHLAPELRSRVKSIVVKEFGGIDHLPDKISGLKEFKI